MKKRLLVVAMVLGLTLSFTSSGWAQQTDVLCCCNALCYYNYRGSSLLSPPEVFTMSFDECDIVEEGPWVSAEDICKGALYVVQFCEYRIDEAAAELEKTIIAEEYRIWTSFASEGECRVEGEIDCPIDYMLGEEDGALDILRQFRDEVLSKSEKGGKLIDAYYKYGDLLIKAFKANPAIEVFATELLGKTIERLLLASGSDEELLTDEMEADIDILADELDAVVKSPGLKKTLRQIKGDMKRGKLF